MRQLSPLRLSLQFSLLIVLPLYLLDPLVVIVHCRTERLLCPLLPDHVLIEVLLQRFGCYPGGANYGCASQWTSRRLTSLIYACPSLAREV